MNNLWREPTWRGTKINVALFDVVHPGDSVSVSGHIPKFLIDMGEVSRGDYQYNGWNAYWKILHWNQSPQSEIHLWITNAMKATHTFDHGNEHDVDAIENVGGSAVVYLHWGGTTRPHMTSAAEMQNVIKETVDVMMP